MSEDTARDVLLDRAQDKIAVLDESGVFTYVNRAVEQLGYDPEDLIGENAFEYIHPADREDVQRVFEETVGDDGFADISAGYRFRTADGSWVWYESRMSNLTDAELDGYVVSSRDVTDRVEAEHERRETARRLEELARASDDVLWMFTGDWSELLFINEAYEEVYGQPVADIEADPTAFLETVHPDDLRSVEAAMEALSDGKPVDVEYRVNRDRDYGVWVWVQGQPIVKDGEVVRIAGFTRDVTERHRRERQLYVIDNLLRHNLRNDMNVVLGAVETIEATAPDLCEEAAVIRRTSENLLASVEKERDIIDLLVSDPVRTDIDLVGVVDRAVESVSERFPRATIERSLPAEVTVTAVQKLGLAVVELLENAVRHSGGERPQVTVTVRRTDDGATLVVSDDCPPIPDKEAGVLSGDHDMSDVYHSTGLGLWLVYWVVERSGGRLAVDRGEGAGNAVTVELPAPSDEPPPDDPSESAATQTTSVSDSASSDTS